MLGRHALTSRRAGNAGASNVSYTAYGGRMFSICDMAFPASNSRPASPPKLPESGHWPWFCFIGKRGRSATVRTGGVGRLGVSGVVRRYAQLAADHLAPYAERLGSLTPKPEAEHLLARQQKKSLAIRALSHEDEQRLFRSVQLSAAVGNQFVKRIKVPANHFSVLEAIEDLGTDIRTAADSRCVTENISRLLNRFDYLPLSRSALLADFRAQPRQRTCTNERTRPRAKIFSAEVFAHYFTNVVVDVMARNVYELTIIVLIFEDFA